MGLDGSGDVVHDLFVGAGREGTASGGHRQGLVAGDAAAGGAEPSEVFEVVVEHPPGPGCAAGVSRECAVISGRLDAFVGGIFEICVEPCLNCGDDVLNYLFVVVATVFLLQVLSVPDRLPRREEEHIVLHTWQYRLSASVDERSGEEN